MNETAYRTTDPDVLAQWEQFIEGTEATRVKRAALVEAVGRDIYVNRGNGYGSTRVVGFARFDSDKDGDILHHEGSLIVSSRRGAHNGLIVPNLRRKSGKVFAEELREYTSPSLTMNGMPTFHMYSRGGGVYVGGPAVTLWDGVLYAYWECDNAPVKEPWEQILLSAYYAAKEQHDVSGNEDDDDRD